MARELIEHLLPQGVGGFYVCGGTGEGILLTEAERRLMAETAVGQVAGASRWSSTWARSRRRKRAGWPPMRSRPARMASAPSRPSTIIPASRASWSNIAPSARRPGCRFYVYNIPGRSDRINVTPGDVPERCASRSRPWPASSSPPTTSSRCGRSSTSTLGGRVAERRVGAGR